MPASTKLEEAVQLHQRGQLEQAARLYREVLAAHPDNADALHLIGMIALQQGRAADAIAPIRKAIALQGRNASYHFHLALALQTLNRLDDAVAAYHRAMAINPDDLNIYNNLGNALAAQGKLDQTMAAFAHLLSRQPDNAVAHNNLGHVQAQSGLQHEAEESFVRAIALQPEYAGAFVNLGNIHRDKSDFRAMEGCYRRAVALAPRDAASHGGLGVALWKLGQHDEAMACYRAALSVDPQHFETLVNQGIAHWEAGELADAENLLGRAQALRPDQPDILDNLASLRLSRGDTTGTLRALQQSMAIAQTPRNQKLFVALMRHANASHNDAALRKRMAQALSEPWDRPALLAPASARLIRAHPAIGHLVVQADAHWPNPMSVAQLLGDAGFTPLADEALLLALLTATPNMDIALERFLTLLRSAMLRELAQDSSTDTATMLFAAALAQQCFINEYVFACDDAEMATAHALLENANAVTPMRILLAACYLPLHSLPGAARLTLTLWPAPVEMVLTQQLREPQAEMRLRTDIPRLTRIADAVSLLVQDQYEENPYPRWVRQPSSAPDTIQNFVSGKFPFARFDRNPGHGMRDVLIAGCGTGQRSIAMAQKFGAQNILAVDLSLASLCYARRKSDELGLAITHGQADLLELETLGRQFDLIESLGVLHHLADPFEGWRRLLAILRPGGFMLLGFYSESARRPITQARADIREQGLEPNAGDIRSFRQALIQSGTADASILSSEDFFSLSACRDLLFHIQEHPTNIAALAHFIERHGLHFLGFELDDAVLAAYRNRFAQDKAATDLACWQDFEADHPGLFGGMYVFWIQKPVGADAGAA